MPGNNNHIENLLLDTDLDSWVKLKATQKFASLYEFLKQYRARHEQLHGYQGIMLSILAVRIADVFTYGAVLTKLLDNVQYRRSVQKNATMQGRFIEYRKNFIDAVFWIESESGELCVQDALGYWGESKPIVQRVVEEIKGICRYVLEGEKYVLGQLPKVTKGRILRMIEYANQKYYEENKQAGNNQHSRRKRQCSKRKIYKNKTEELFPSLYNGGSKNLSL